MIETPQNIQPYIDALGEELTLSFIMKFGGSPVYLPSSDNTQSDVRAVLGAEGTKALANVLGPGQIGRVPIAREWTIRQLKARKWSTLAIARELRVTDETVRRILNDRPSRQSSFSF